MFQLVSNVLLFIFFQRISADGIFEISLNVIENNEKGNCCDNIVTSWLFPPPLITSTFVPINHNRTRGIRPTAECKTKCNTSLKICLRHYEKTVSYNGDCSYGESIVASDEFSKIHQIKFNFTWVREFSIILEAFHTSGSGRDATKKRFLMHSFQEAMEVSSDWKEKTIVTNQTIIVAKMRVLCARYYFGEGCSQKCSPRNDRYGHFECDEDGKKCLSGWKGDYCDIPICAEGCRNGTCKTPGKCDCTNGYEGILCDKCRVHPNCQHGSCKKPWECNCEDGWGGSFCDKDLNYCTRHRPCVNGLCFNAGQRSYTCSCFSGFTGVNCDIPVFDCSTAPCRNGGICSQSSPGTNYLCICPPGYVGVNCENRLNSCDQAPCLNGATCQPSRFSSLSYICNCRSGFNGTHCENYIAECAPNFVCFNGGTCIAGDNSYTCLCSASFFGRNCQSVVRSAKILEDGPNLFFGYRIHSKSLILIIIPFVFLFTALQIYLAYKFLIYKQNSKAFNYYALV